MAHIYAGGSIWFDHRRFINKNTIVNTKYNLDEFFIRVCDRLDGEMNGALYIHNKTGSIYLSLDEQNMVLLQLLKLSRGEEDAY